MRQPVVEENLFKEKKEHNTGVPSASPCTVQYITDESCPFRDVAPAKVRLLAEVAEYCGPIQGTMIG